jgi:hypothetical protein
VSCDFWVTLTLISKSSSGAKGGKVDGIWHPVRPNTHCRNGFLKIRTCRKPLAPGRANLKIVQILQNRFIQPMQKRQNGS